MTRATARLVDFMTHQAPVLDTGWRVALYPEGTSLSTALAAEVTKQTAAGFTIDPATAALLPDYFIRGTSDTLPDGEDRTGDHGWRDAPAVFGTVCLRYRLAGPGIHNP